MPTITVYVSDEAQEKINKRREQLNLSELARRAIMLEIARLEEREKPGNLTQLTARIREEKAETEDESYHKGFEMGKIAAAKWKVFDYAAFNELDKKKELLREYEPTSYWDLLPDTVKDWLNDKMTMEELKERDYIFEGYDEEEWLHGFGQGALVVWEEIRYQL